MTPSPHTLAHLRALLRHSLHDEDPSSYRWPTPALDRHLHRSLLAVDSASPALASLLTPMPRTAHLDLSAHLPPSLLWFDAVEYPPHRYPPSHLPFYSGPGPRLRILSPVLPPPGAEIAVWYAHGYTLAESSSDLPPHLAPVVLLGARAGALADHRAPTSTHPDPTAEAARAADAYATELARLRAAYSSPRWRPFWQLV